MCRSLLRHPKAFNRARCIEDARLSLSYFEAAGDIDVNHCQVYAAPTAARVFRDESKLFVNLSLYEPRRKIGKRCATTKDITCRAR